MKILLSTSLFALATVMAFGADYYLTSGANVDILNLENWGATEITSSDTLNITNDGTSAVLEGTGKSFSFNHMNIRGNVSLDILGSGNTLTGKGTSNSNVYLGSNENNSSVLNILGYGNSFSDKSGWSFMMGNVTSVSGQNLVRVHSSSAEASGRNSFAVPSSVNSFIYLSTAENSAARNTVSIGDNSSATFQSNLFVGANSSNSAIKSGVAEIVLDGKGSALSFNDLFVGANNGSQEGGTAQIVMGGQQNTVSVTKNMRIGGSNNGNYNAGSLQRGGTNGIYISGENNEFTTTAAISVASAWDMSGGVNEFVVSGTGNAVNFNTAQVGYGNGSNIFSGGTNRFLVSGTGNVITASQGINAQADNQTGGVAIFEVAGSNNEIYFSGNNQVGRAMKGGENRWVLGGENNKAEYKSAMSFLIGRTAMTGGEAALEIRGKNNTFKTFNLFIGNEATTNGKAKFIVEGSGHTINVENSFQSYFSGNEGGGFEFIADADGFSTVNINNFDTTFTGLIEIDFSKYIVKDEINGDEFTLISIKNKAQNLLLEIEGDLDQYFSITGSDDYELLFGDKTLGVRVFSTNVPEPATYAAIFGALALAFAAWRRRK